MLRRLCPAPLSLPLALAALLFITPYGFAPPVPQGKANPEPPAAGTEEARPNETVASRRISINNLKQIGIAIHSYHDTYGKLPADIVDQNGKVLLSWRVLLLPYLEHDNLFKKFKLDEPWDSKNNKPLLAQMPKVFASPRVALKNKGYTVYQGFSGPDALFHSGKPGRRFAQITDGLSNTLMTVESTTAVPWSKPVDIEFDGKKDVVKFGKAFGEKPLALLGDGSVRTLDLKKVSKETLKGAITISGGEVLGPDW